MKVNMPEIHRCVERSPTSATFFHFPVSNPPNCSVPGHFVPPSDD